MKAESGIWISSRLIRAVAVKIGWKALRLRYQSYPAEKDGKQADIRLRILHGVREQLRKADQKWRVRQKHASKVSSSCAKRINRKQPRAYYENTNHHHRT